MDNANESATAILCLNSQYLLRQVENFLLNCSYPSLNFPCGLPLHVSEFMHLIVIINLFSMVDFLSILWDNGKYGIRYELQVEKKKYS